MDHRWCGRPKKDSYITLIAVLIAGAVATATAVSLIAGGLLSSRTSFSLERANQSKALANACAEEALQQIQDSSSFTGSATVSLGQGSCSYTVTNTGGTTRSVTSSGTVGTTVRRVQITIDQVNPTINLTSWQEVVSF